MISMLRLDTQIILLACIVVTGLAMLLQTIILLAIFFALRKSAKAVREQTQSLHTAIMPVIFDARDMLANTQGILASAQDFLTSAQGLLNRISPKVETAVGDLAQITEGLREQSTGLQSSVTEIVERVQRQSDRIDSMLSSFLDTVDRAGSFAALLVSKPVRQVSGVISMVRAVVDSLRSNGVRR
jgi:adhesin HecA-like repeat protein